MTKRPLAILAVLLSLGFFLVGCGGDTSDPAAEEGVLQLTEETTIEYIKAEKGEPDTHKILGNQIEVLTYGPYTFSGGGRYKQVSFTFTFSDGKLIDHDQIWR